MQVAGELRVEELAGELARLARRLRGTDPEVLVEALAALLPAEEARAGLVQLARRDDRAGEQARAALEAAALNARRRRAVQVFHAKPANRPRRSGLRVRTLDVAGFGRILCARFRPG